MPELATSADAPFVGRQKDLDALHALLMGGGLVTLVGPAGVGKTRLVSELLRRNASDFPEPALCDLLEAQTAEDAAAMTAHALGVSLDGADSSVGIGDALESNQDGLLVLDNFEHLIDVASVLVDAWSRRGTVLVISRHRLAVSSGAQYVLDPLSLADDADGSAAEQLFLQKLRQVHPQIQLSTDDRAAVKKRVRELDGLPLSIELCAASTELPLAQGLRAESTTQSSTLEQILGDSVSALPAELCQLWVRCAAFRGGFDERAAHAIGGMEREDQTSAGLLALAERSLLLVKTTKGDEQPRRRYGMLALLREYAAARLKASGDETDVLTKHAAHFTQLSQRATELYLTGASAQSRGLVRKDADNLLAVHRRAIQHRIAPESAARAAVECVLGVLPALGGLGPLTGLVSRLDACLSRFATELDTETETRALIARSRILDHIGRPAEALGSAKMARERARELDSRSLAARAADVEGRALLQLGRWQDAEQTLTLAISELTALGMDAHVARAHVALGDVAYYRDDLALAETRYETAVRLAEQVADAALIGIATARLAIVLMELGQTDLASARFEAAQRQHAEAFDWANAANSATYQAVLEQDRGRLDSARARLETLQVVTRERGQRRLSGIVLLYLGSVLFEMGEAKEAVTTLESAERILGETSTSSALAHARSWRAAALASLDETDAAQQLLDLALGVLRTKQEQSFYRAVAEIHGGHLDLAAARAADAVGDALAAAAHRGNARRRLDAVKLPYQTDVRIARRTLERALGQRPRAVSEPPPASQRSGLMRAMLIEETGAWFRPPASDDPVDISGRTPLRKLLATLIQARVHHPGEVVSTSTLFEATWSDTTDTATLQNRLRVAIATLRKLGLATHLYTRGGGYLLDPKKPILASGSSPD